MSTLLLLQILQVLVRPSEATRSYYLYTRPLFVSITAHPMWGVQEKHQKDKIQESFVNNKVGKR